MIICTQNKIAIRNQIKIIKFHSAKNEYMKMVFRAFTQWEKLKLQQKKNILKKTLTLAKCNNLKWKDITMETKL